MGQRISDMVANSILSHEIMGTKMGAADAALLKLRPIGWASQPAAEEEKHPVPSPRRSNCSGEAADNTG